MNASVDRTRELEQRLRAILVQSIDTCIFFLRREDADPSEEKRCACCAWAEFRPDLPEEPGLCKFKHHVTKEEIWQREGRISGEPPGRFPQEPLSANKKEKEIKEP